MKKLLVPVITLVACLMLTYSTTAYASQEEATPEVMPVDDGPMTNYPLDPYNN